ncbi:MAG: phospho-N-acetylmuramoyl-pentapeptide-transferase [Deltaproteobacteria bacterium]|nr:phospho-N-acetylmuramoyl-pentapeptide-transferase [Deltaproteobacteria bacterium]
MVRGGELGDAVLPFRNPAPRQHFTSLNVVRYVSFRIMAAFITSLVICLVLYPWFIRALQKRAVGQHIRSDGPQSHLSKEGTPTMGGALIMVSIIMSGFLWTQFMNPLVMITLGLGMVFGIVGFVDDLRKLGSRSSKGLSVRFRLVVEFGAVVAVMAWFMTQIGSDISYDQRLFIPFMSAERYWLDLPLWLYLILAAIVIVGTSNATNLTDGLDGLAAGPVLTAAGTLLILTYVTGAKLGGFDISKYLLIPKVIGAQELSIICSAVMGATIGFLYYNTYPAEIFMGDTGSLGLGGLLGAMAVLTKNELLSVIIFGVFFFEAVSVILQTTYFKFTRRRIFPMSPVHHSFELMGWPEPKIVVRFWIISLLLAMVALASIKVR